MQLIRFLIATVALTALTACGSTDDNKPTNHADPTPAAIKTNKIASVVIDPVKVEQGIVQKFAETFNEPEGTVTSASCPEEISSSLGDETTCDVDFSNGRYGNATIKIVDENGDFKIVGVSRSVG